MQITQQALAGDAKSQCNLGVSYMEVGRSPKDYAEAVKLFRKSAEQGNVQAQSNLGHAYYLGHGVKKNSGEAMKWFRMAAEQGHRDRKSVV